MKASRQISMVIVAALTAGALVLWGAPSLAQGKGKGQGQGPGPAFAPDDEDDDDQPDPGPHGLLKALKALGKEIGVTEDQKAEIKALIKDAREDIAPLRQQVADLRQQMHDLMKAKKLDKKKILAKDAEIQAVMQQIHSRRIELAVDALEVLTAEQREKLFEELEKCHKGEGVCPKGFGKGKGPGQGKGQY